MRTELFSRVGFNIPLIDTRCIGILLEIKIFRNNLIVGLLVFPNASQAQGTFNQIHQNNNHHNSVCIHQYINNHCLWSYFLVVQEGRFSVL